MVDVAGELDEPAFAQDEDLAVFPSILLQNKRKIAFADKTKSLGSDVLTEQSSKKWPL